MLAKVEQKRKRNNVLDKTFYCCTKYRKFGKEGCSSHTIEARTVHEVVLADIQKHAGQASVSYTHLLPYPMRESLKP